MGDAEPLGIPPAVIFESELHPAFTLNVLNGHCLELADTGPVAHLIDVIEGFARVAQFECCLRSDHQHLGVTEANEPHIAAARPLVHALGDIFADIEARFVHIEVVVGHGAVDGSDDAAVLRIGLSGGAGDGPERSGALVHNTRLIVDARRPERGSRVDDRAPQARVLVLEEIFGVVIVDVIASVSEFQCAVAVVHILEILHEVQHGKHRIRIIARLDRGGEIVGGPGVCLARVDVVQRPDHLGVAVLLDEQVVEVERLVAVLAVEAVLAALDNFLGGFVGDFVELRRLLLGDADLESRGFDKAVVDDVVAGD